MTYTPPAGVIDAQWSATPYTGARSNITGSWAPVRPVAPVGIEAPAAGTAHALLWQQFIAPAGIYRGGYGAARVTDAEAYIYPQHWLSASWEGAEPYAPPSPPLNVSWSTSQRDIAVAGFDSLQMPEPALHWTLFAAPEGFHRGTVGEPFAIHDYQYAYPEWEIVASWVGKQPYTPPTGLIHGQWLKDFGPKDVAPLGHDSAALGVPSIQVMRAYVEPAGSDSAEFGTGQIHNAAGALYPAGIASRMAFGTHSLQLHTRYVLPSGFYRGTYGRPKVELYRAYLRPTGFDPSGYGTATLSGGIRTVSVAGRGIEPGAAGRPTVTFRERLVIPVGWDARSFGMPTMGYHVTLEPEGYDAARFGTTEVSDNSQRTHTTGRQHDEHGEPFISLRVRTLVQHPTVSPGGIGLAEVRNLRRYIEPYSERDDWGPFFPNFGPFVANRNRTIAAYGHVSSRFSLTTLLENAAVPVRPAPFDSSRFGDAMVAYRVRYLPLEGWESSVLSRWAVAYNGARPVLPPSVPGQAEFGKPTVVNTRRYLRWVGGLDAAEFGDAYADYGVRTVEQIFPERPPYVPIPTIMLRQRFLFPASFGGVQLGLPHVEERFTRFYPRWVFVEQIGHPALANRNRSFMPYGYDMAEFGNAKVYNYVQEVQAEGWTFLRFGSCRISDSRQTVAPVGAMVFRIGNGTRVQLHHPDLPYPRTIFPGSIVVEVGYGRPTVRSNSIYPAGIGSAMRAGTPTVVSMGISPKGIYLAEADQYGRPTLNFNQYLYPDSVIPVENKQKHRIDPHTIWATTDTPSQAVQNHDGKVFRPIDSTQNIGVGRPRVTTPGPATARPVGSNHSRYGTPRVDLRVRYIRTTGFNTFRYGWPRLPGTIFCGPLSITSGGFGLTRVEHYVDPMRPQTATGRGFVASAWGTTKVELQNREVRPSGFNAANIPRVMRVGPPRRLETQGDEMDSFGTAWASLRVRSVYPFGFESFAEGYETGSFDLRMRVKVDYPTRRALAAGRDMSGFGMPGVMNNARVISPLNCCCYDDFGRPIAAHA